MKGHKITIDYLLLILYLEPWIDPKTNIISRDDTGHLFFFGLILILQDDHAAGNS